MAVGQRASKLAQESMDDFVARRRREKATQEAAYALGQMEWAASTRNNDNLQARTPSEVTNLGRRRILYGALEAPSPTHAELAELRRQQAVLDKETTDVSKDNRWMAIPALAPAAVVMGLEGLALAARSLAPSVATAEPLVLRQRWPYQRGGETPTTQAGRQAHKVLTAKVNAKPGWRADRVAEGTRLRPDAAGPARGSAQPKKRFQLELKPNTEAGRRAAAKAVEKYETKTGNKTRAIYYDPKDFM